MEASNHYGIRSLLKHAIIQFVCLLGPPLNIKGYITMVPACSRGTLDYCAATLECHAADFFPYKLKYVYNIA